MFAAVLPSRQNEICSLSTDCLHWCFAGDPIKSVCPTTNNLPLLVAAVTTQVSGISRASKNCEAQSRHPAFQIIEIMVLSRCRAGLTELFFSPLYPLYCCANSSVNYPSSVPSLLADLMLLMFPICAAGNILTETRFAEMWFASHLKPPQKCVGYPVSSKSHSTCFLLLSGLPKINRDTICNVSKNGLRPAAWTRLAVCATTSSCMLDFWKKKKDLCFLRPVFLRQQLI